MLSAIRTKRLLQAREQNARKIVVKIASNKDPDDGKSSSERGRRKVSRARANTESRKARQERKSSPPKQGNEFHVWCVREHIQPLDCFQGVGRRESIQVALEGLRVAGNVDNGFRSGLGKAAGKFGM